MNGRRVLLVDADPQGSLSISLGIKNPDELNKTLSDIMLKIMRDEPFDESFALIRCGEGVDLMPCNIELSGIEASMFNAMSRESILKEYIDRMRPKYDYILIDLPPIGSVIDAAAVSGYVDGIIVAPVEGGESAIRKAIDMKVPVVLLDREPIPRPAGRHRLLRLAKDIVALL